MDSLASMVPLAGGWSGRTFVAEAAGERQVVRIFLPGEGRELDVNAALLRLVRHHLPVPEVLEVRRGDVATDAPGLLITSWVAGERGDVVLPRLDDDGLGVLGRNVGELLVVLGAMPQLRAGLFRDGELGVEPFGDVDLVEHVAATLPLLAHWDEAEREGLHDVAAASQALLDTVDGVVLVHSDLNPKNLLVDPETLTVTALVDWEFAHAGHPFTDLGNVLRFDRAPAYAQGVLTPFCERQGLAPDDALRLGRAADLYALVELAGRHGRSPVTDRAERLLRGIAAAGDAGWTPARGRT